MSLNSNTIKEQLASMNKKISQYQQYSVQCTIGSATKTLTLNLLELHEIIQRFEELNPALKKNLRWQELLPCLKFTQVLFRREVLDWMSLSKKMTEMLKISGEQGASIPSILSDEMTATFKTLVQREGLVEAKFSVFFKDLNLAMLLLKVDRVARFNDYKQKFNQLIEEFAELDVGKNECDAALFYVHVLFNQLDKRYRILPKELDFVKLKFKEHRAFYANIHTAFLVFMNALQGEPTLSDAYFEHLDKNLREFSVQVEVIKKAAKDLGDDLAVAMQPVLQRELLMLFPQGVQDNAKDMKSQSPLCHSWSILKTLKIDRIEEEETETFTLEEDDNDQTSEVIVVDAQGALVQEQNSKRQRSN